MRILLYGGTFDPPTIAHQAILRKAISIIEADIAFVQLAVNPPHRNTLGTIKQRRDMVELGFSSHEKTIITNFEPESQVSYTYLTVQEIAKKFPKAEIWVLMGEDEFNTFHQWREPFTILSLANLLICTRGDSSSSTRNVIRNGKFREQIKFMTVQEVNHVSATQFRKDSAKHIDWVCKPVLNYIQTNKIY